MRKLLVVGVDMDGHFFVQDIKERQRVFEFLRENYFGSLQENADTDLYVSRREDVKCEHCHSIIKHKRVRDEDKVKRIEGWLLNMLDEEWVDLVMHSTMRGCFEVVDVEF